MRMTNDSMLDFKKNRLWHATFAEKILNLLDILNETPKFGLFHGSQPLRLLL